MASVLSLPQCVIVLTNLHQLYGHKNGCRVKTVLPVADVYAVDSGRADVFCAVVDSVTAEVVCADVDVTSDSVTDDDSGNVVDCCVFDTVDSVVYGVVDTLLERGIFVYKSTYV